MTWKTLATILILNVFILTASCGTKKEDKSETWYAAEKVPRAVANADETTVMDTLKCDYLLLELSQHGTQAECENALSTQEKRDGVEYFCSPTSLKNDQCKKA